MHQIALLLSLVTSAMFSHLDFRNIGPLPGRIDTVSGVSGDPRVYYGGGLGGLFKSSDGGVSWEPVFHQQSVSSIGAVAVAPSDPSIVYAGTGEPNLRNDVAFGNGVYKSSDAGATWQHVGLDASGSVARIAIDPVDPQRVFVAVSGDFYAANGERGIFKTTDGGTTWRKVLSSGERTGASSVAIDPRDPKHLIAGMWEAWRTPYHLNSGGKDDGLYASSDGGEHWARLQGNGLPGGTMGRIDVRFAPGNPKRVYALIESNEGTLWRSDDGGKTWAVINTSHGIDQRPFYFTTMAVDPKDENHLFFMSVQMWESKDGGKTAKTLRGTRGGDYHALWIDPQDPHRMVAGDDGGIQYTVGAPKGWTSAAVAVSQPYHVDTDNRVPYTVCAETQDSGSACGSSTNTASNRGDWFYAGGGESGWIVFDRGNSNLIYGDGYQGALTEYDRRTDQARAIDVWPEDAMGWAAAALKYRFQWTSPLAVSAHHAHRLFMGGNKVFATDDGGQHWRAISGDLTRNAKQFEQFSGGLTRDNTSVEYYDTVFSIAESPLRAGTLWAGTDDGYVWVTRDEGAHWNNVTPAAMRADAPGAWGRVDGVAPSPFDPAVAYMTADYHKSGSRVPHLYRTADYGRTWTAIAQTLPQDSYARMVRPDPVRRGMLYAGTETGLWLSYDDGAHWMALNTNLPTAPVYDFHVQRQFDDLVVATHGRGIWILDNLHALQELNDAAAAQPLHLFTLRPAYRSVSGQEALIDFFLKQPPASGGVRVEVLQDGRVIRTLAVEKPAAGINRVRWNLQYEDLKPVKNYVPWGSGGFDGPAVLPGRYTVRVTAGGISRTGSLQVRLDPRVHVAATALREQLTFIQRARGDLSSLTALINRLNVLKAKNGRNAAKIDALLHRIYEPEVTEGEDALRYPQQVYGKIAYLAGNAGASDARPTASDYAVLNALETRARALEREARSLTTP
ncbi:MAG: sialidase [Candidatus Baltobacteraceae bacterium]